MAVKSWDQVVGELGVWKRGGERAVHKPLLLLFLLGRAQRGQSPRLGFSEIEAPLLDALLELGPPRKTVHPEYPFWHLQGDGIWSVTSAGRGGSLTRPGTPSAAALRDQAAVGELDAGLWAALKADPALVSRVAQTLLDQFWPESYHDAILARVGLDLGAPGSLPAAPAAGQGASNPRDPAFRQAVLRAYEGRCAVCGYDARLGNVPFGLEAAHIRWHAYEGPCEVPNGLALCALHHAAFDWGALGLTDDLRVLVSQDVRGQAVVRVSLVDLSGKPLDGPQSRKDWPRPEFVAWHRKQVFRAPEREVDAQYLMAAEGTEDGPGKCKE